jgi:hypothetical protein
LICRHIIPTKCLVSDKLTGSEAAWITASDKNTGGQAASGTWSVDVSKRDYVDFVENRKFPVTTTGCVTVQAT